MVTVEPKGQASTSSKHKLVTDTPQGVLAICAHSHVPDSVRKDLPHCILTVTDPSLPLKFSSWGY